MKKPFIDSITISVQAGRGGNGCVSFRREKFVPRGGPDGGNGGRGGNVFLIASREVPTLIDFFYRSLLTAGNGLHGQGKKKAGRNGKDLVVKVPCGTLVKDSETGKILQDLVRDGQEFLLAGGGRGGRGNATFATSTNQAPRIAEDGEAGEEGRFSLELRLIADVGLVGYPNAGKSTLISRISHAHPKIASYPFTTLTPVLGVVENSNFRRLTIADIPGLVEGAHQNRGRGHDFLRHIERTQLLLFILDMAAVDGRAPADDYKNLHNELTLHNPMLERKPFLIAANKMDLPQAAANLEKFRCSHLIGPEKIFPISALKGEGLKELTQALFSVLHSVSNKSCSVAITFNEDSSSQKRVTR